MPRIEPRRRSLLLTITVLFALACEVPGVTPLEVEPVVATSGAKSTGDGQTARVLTAVAIPPTLLVADQMGRPMRGVLVNFSATNNGVLGAASITTGDNGLASVGSWTLGCGAGTQTLTASPSGLSPVTFSATATAAVPSAIVKVTTTDNQSGTVNTAIANAPSVTVRDASGAPSGCVTVTFAATSGSGSVTSASQITNAAGVATVGGWTLGTVAGAQTVTATVGGTAISTTFSATANAGPAASVAANSPTSVSANTNSAVSPSPSVVVKDQFGNNVSGNAVAWTIPSGGGTVASTAAVNTGVNGVSTAPTWTMGSTAGTYALRATATGASITGNPVNFTATATTPNTLAISAGNNQTAGTNQTVATQPSVIVRNAASAPVSGVSVTFTIATGGGTVGTGSPPTTTTFTTTTNTSGIASASWKLGGTAGSNTLTVSCSTCSPTSVTFTATAVSANTLAIQQGNNQSGTVGSTLSTFPTVVVRDPSGAAMVGVSILWSVASGSGTIGGGTSGGTSTGGTGLAQPPGSSWTLGTTAGTQSLTATVSGVTTVPQSITFTATANAGAPASLTKRVGDNQTSAAGQATPIVPEVLVRDSFNNPVGSVAVAFSVASGGGSVAGGNATTGADGVASPTTWTLGTSPGTNTLNAAVSGLTPVTFTATGVDACGSAPAAISTSQTINGSLATSDCLQSGFYLDKYRLTLSSQAAVTITQSSGAFQPKLDYGSPFNFTNSTATAVNNRFYLAAGTYDFSATSNSTGATGSYTLTTAASVVGTGCNVIDITRGVNITDRILSEFDCTDYTITNTGGGTSTPASGARYAESFTINLTAGQSVTFDMPSCAFDSYIELRQGLSKTGTSVAADDDDGPGTCSNLTFVPATSGFYTLWITTFGTAAGGGSGTGGAYTLTVSP